MNLRRLKLFAFLPFLLFNFHPAHASGAIELLVAPITLGAPSSAPSSTTTPGTLTYPNAFSGLGLGAQLDYYFNSTPWGLTAGVISQGNGKLEYVRAKYYFSGHAQYARMDSVAKASESLVTESKTRGLYAEIGLAPYQLTEVVTTSTSSVQDTTSGIGGVAGIGMEQPFFWGTFLGLRANFFSAFGSTSVNVVIFNVAIGIPFAF